MLMFAVAPPDGGWSVVAIVGPPVASGFGDGWGALGTGVTAADPPGPLALGCADCVPVDEMAPEPPVPVDEMALEPPVPVDEMALEPPVPVDETEPMPLEAIALEPPVPVDPVGARDAAGDELPPPPHATATSAITEKSAVVSSARRCVGAPRVRSAPVDGELVTRTPPRRPPLGTGVET
jgi:hypothetical protein